MYQEINHKKQVFSYKIKKTCFINRPLNLYLISINDGLRVFYVVILDISEYKK